ncbi:hypothetical protein D4R71_00515 [bacterium]|nr:MAG: hypothetical protein D4R71_00515 [bacterium]
MRTIYIGGAIIAMIICWVCISLIGCACISKDHHKFYGWGHAKIDKDGNVTEIESSPPISLPKVEF